MGGGGEGKQFERVRGYGLISEDKEGWLCLEHAELECGRTCCQDFQEEIEGEIGGGDMEVRVPVIKK